MIIAITAVKTTGIRMSHIAVTVCKIERTSKAISFAHPICLQSFKTSCKNVGALPLFDQL